jgi:hypothetical protein
LFSTFQEIIVEKVETGVGRSWSKKSKSQQFLKVSTSLESLDRSWQVFGMFSAVSTMVAMILAMVLTWRIVNIVSTAVDIVANVVDIYILNKILVFVSIDINCRGLHTLIV